MIKLKCQTIVSNPQSEKITFIRDKGQDQSGNTITDIMIEITHENLQEVERFKPGRNYAIDFLEMPDDIKKIEKPK